MMNEGQALFNSSFIVPRSSFPFVPALGAGAVEDLCVAPREFDVGEAAHDALAARAEVLQRAPVARRVVEAEAADDLLQIVEPHLPDELRAAAGTTGLRRLALAP